jgi:hypothetical protein
MMDDARDNWCRQSIFNGIRAIAARSEIPTKADRARHLVATVVFAPERAQNRLFSSKSSQNDCSMNQIGSGLNRQLTSFTKPPVRYILVGRASRSMGATQSVKNIPAPFRLVAGYSRNSSRQSHHVSNAIRPCYFFLPVPIVGCHPAVFWLGAAAIVLTLSFLGFFTSRLPFCSPLAIVFSFALS